MLVIKSDQVDVFRDASLKRFEDEMVEHVKAFFPNHYNAMQEGNVRKTIQYGYLRASTYGFTTIRNVCLYLNNMLLLGSNFDVDPQYPWARKILIDENITEPILKIDELSDKTLSQLKQVAGPNNIYIYRAILNFTCNADDIFKRLNESDLSKSLYHLNLLYKQKFEVIGEGNLKQMIEYGIANAAKYGIRSEPNVLIYVVFMFMMGSGFDKDPQFPWVKTILHENTLSDEHKKIEVLYATAINNLKDAISQYKH